MLNGNLLAFRTCLIRSHNCHLDVGSSLMKRTSLLEKVMLARSRRAS